MPKKVEMAGKKFNKLTVLSEDQNRCNDGKVKWICRCDCGNVKSISGSEIRSGGTRSCGCVAGIDEIMKNPHYSGSENKAFKHGGTGTSEYTIWKGLKARCYNKNNPHYKEYGERGITVCDRWLNSFANFFEDMGQKPSNLHSIDRRRNDGNYEPSNCYWATKKEQGGNKRNNRILTHDGRTMILQDWANFLGVPVSTLHSRLKVKTLEQIYNESEANRS